MEILERYTLFDSKLPTSTGIYRIFNKISGKQYIGSASSLGINGKKCARGFNRRIRYHRYQLKNGVHHCKHLQSSYNYYVGKLGYKPNDVFEFQILEYVPSHLCIEVEDSYFQKYKPEYNGARTARGGGHLLGRKHKPETIEKIRAAQKGKVFSKEECDRIAGPYYLVSPEGVIFRGVNLTSFCEEHGLESTNLNQVMKGKHLHSDGWTANLETHKLYIEAYQERGISWKKRDRLWMVQYYELGKKKAKGFKIKDDAVLFRDNLVSSGYKFMVQARGWKEILIRRRI